MSDGNQPDFRFGCDRVRIRFCPECNNMLYQRQNKEQRTLVFFCRTCLYQREATKDQYCVYINNIKHDINELSLINPDLVDDPTLARTYCHPCPKCHHKEAVFMQGSHKESNNKMKLYYVCTNVSCKFKWTE
ncbi:DNA-directed RNA polymerase II subunit RPB9-like [Oppia nitens]|uniref:DNA-directed RNA polymerase II subunit RPB9-like n=1 Tax=Oppia nitens TaxID=1686743 RepID=UPI0023DC3E26|nr:DNA-directed RNA polymerase II subunit RPB9-like [Oppia nitens]